MAGSFQKIHSTNSLTGDKTMANGAQTQRSTIEHALKVMYQHLPDRFYVKSPETTRTIGISGEVLKRHLGCKTWQQVYDDFVLGDAEIPDNTTLEKRINPKTGNLFVKGEVCAETGKVFMHYKLREVNQDHLGYCREYWTTAEQFNKKQADDAFIKSMTAAKKRNLEWNISTAKQEELLEQKHCPVCGIRMRMPWEDFPRKKRTPIPASFSIDRLDNEVGYIDSNVNSICHGCNTLKGAMSREDIVRVAQRLAEFVTEEK